MEAPITNLEGKIALITGSTDGVGRFVARRLGAAGAEVFVHGRDADRGGRIVDEIKTGGGKARFFAADLSDLADVRGLAQAVSQQTHRLDLLVNNAGIGSGGANAKRQVNGAGCELRFAVNYLAGFALTHLLLPLLKASAPARIVNVSSVGQQAIDFDDVMLTQGYSGARAYMQSKLAQVMFTFDLAESLAASKVTATCLHPASYMATTMVREAGVSPWSTVAEGGEAILNLATSPDLAGRSGLYFDGLRESRANAQTYDVKARARLRALSLDLAGLAPDID